MLWKGRAIQTKMMTGITIQIYVQFKPAGLFLALRVCAENLHDAIQVNPFTKILLRGLLFLNQREGVGNLMVLSSKDFQRGEFYLHINKGLYQLIFTFPPWLASDHNPSALVWQGRPGDSHRFSEMMDTRLWPQHSAVRIRGGRSRAVSPCLLRDVKSKSACILLNT